MRLKQYILNEESIDKEQIKDKLRKDCKYYINLVKKNNTKHKFLYRGMEYKYPFEKKNVRKNRTPLNMPKELTDDFNKRFKKKFGINLRTETLFVSTDKSWTKEYGYNTIIFPIGKFEYYWNPKIFDLFEDLSFGMNSYKKNPLMYQEEIDEVADGYTNKNFKKMMNNFIGEIMLDCKSYYAITPEYENLLLDIFE